MICEWLYIHKDSNHPPNILKEFPSRPQVLVTNIFNRNSVKVSYSGMSIR